MTELSMNKEVKPLKVFIQTLGWPINTPRYDSPAESTTTFLY